MDNLTKQNQENSISKIRYMMNYNSSKTLIENKEENSSSIITEQSAGCPNPTSFEEMQKVVTGIANNVKKMNTAFMRMGKGQARAKSIYQGIQFLKSHNVSDEIDGCAPALEKANEIWSSQFRDWFSKGESMEEELQQLVDGYFRKDPLALRYLNASIKMLKSPATAPEQSSSTAPVTPDQSPVSFAPCKDGINKFGCQSETIKSVQKCLGGLVLDGKFGPKTRDKIIEVGSKQYADQFTDAEAVNICKSKTSQSAPSLPGKINTTPLSMQGFAPSVDVAPKIDNQTLSPSQTTAPVTPSQVNDPRAQRKADRLARRQERMNKRQGFTPPTA